MRGDFLRECPGGHDFWGRDVISPARHHRVTQTSHDRFGQIFHEGKTQRLPSAADAGQKMRAHRFEQPQELDIARAVHRRRTQDDERRAAAFAHFLFAREFAPAVLRDRLRRIVFASGTFGGRGPAGGHAGKIDEPLHAALLLVDRLDDGPRAELVHLVEFADSNCLGAAGGVNHMRHVTHRFAQAGRIAESAQAHFDLREMLLDEPLVGRGPEQHRGGKGFGAQLVEDVTADKSVRSSE